MSDVILPPELNQLLPEPLQSLCQGLWLKRGERLFVQGAVPQWMNFVVQGEVVLERSGAHGETVVLQRTRRGFVSEASLRVARYHCDAVAVRDSTVVRLPIAELDQALRTRIDFAQMWIGMLTGEVHRLRQRVERLRIKSAAERLLHLMESEGRDGRLEVSGGLKLLAAELGLTHEALYRTLARLEADGVIDRVDKALVLTAGRT